MIDKRERIITDPGLGPVDPPGPSTLRSLKAEAAAALSPNDPVYYEPSPLVAISNHKTLEVETVRLSHDIDPRKLRTELRLDRVPSVVPPSDSLWPPETALASSQPPPGPGRRWRTPAVLLSLLCALFVLVGARAVARHSAAVAARESGIVQTVSGAGLAPLVASALPVARVSPTASAVSATASAVSPTASAVSAPSAVPAAPVVSEPAPVSTAPQVHAAVAHAPAAPQSAIKPAHLLSAELAASSASKPKRAIY
ncbi:MAG: hypothetical protein ABI488_18825 [Polyangiaceae bacterium]